MSASEKSLVARVRSPARAGALDEESARPASSAGSSTRCRHGSGSTAARAGSRSRAGVCCVTPAQHPQSVAPVCSQLQLICHRPGSGLRRRDPRGPDRCHSAESRGAPMGQLGRRCTARRQRRAHTLKSGKPHPDHSGNTLRRGDNRACIHPARRTGSCVHRGRRPSRCKRRR